MSGADDTGRDALFDDANGDFALGDLDAALEKFARCVELDPLFFDGWHAKGMTLMKLGRFPEAIEAGLRATRLRPEDPLAWSSLSMFYVRDGRIPEAEAAGAKARVLSWGEKLKKGPSPSDAPATPPDRSGDGGEARDDARGG